MRIMPTVTVLALFATAGCTTALESGPVAVSTTPMAVSAKRVDQVRDDIDGLVRSGVPGVIATLTENGQTVTLTSGVADRAGGAPIPMAPPQQVRIGSISKTFVASIVLQLVAEGRVKLDDPIDTYLPGLLVGDGVDGKVITVRQILQHRSGLPELTEFPEIDEYRAGVLGRTFTPAQEIALVLRHPAQFAPGTQFKYTNTNYIVAGMLVEKVTGRTYSEELSARITTPSQLTGTYLPNTGELTLRGPHPEGYHDIDGVVTDVTKSEPSVPWAAGAMVSTGNDLNRYFLALLAGKIVAAAQLKEMLSTQTGTDVGMDYGLGIGGTQLPCGAHYYGHTGGIAGFTTVSGASTDGRAVTITLTESDPGPRDIVTLLSHALCP